MSGTTYSGRKIKYGLALEATRGTGVAPEVVIRWETADFIDTATTVLNQSAIGVLDKYSNAEIVETWSTGQIAGKITDRGFGLILYAAMGSYSVALKAGESVVYVHTFTESQVNEPTSLTITRYSPNEETQYAMGTLDTLEVDVKVGDYVRHATNFIAQPGTTSAASMPAFEDENEFVSRHATVLFAYGVGNFGGSTPIALESFKLNIKKDIKPYFIIGQNNPVDIVSQDQEITGEMVLRWLDSTYYNLRFNNTLQAVQVTVQNNNVTIGSTSHPTLVFTMPAAFLTEWKPDQSIDGIVTQTINFTATYSLDAGYAISAALTNTVTSYSGASIS
jgi:hypothetical protein